MATNTAASFTSHTGNNSAGPFAISFSYLSEDEIDVTVDGVLKTKTTHYTFPSATTISFTSGNHPANNAAIKFQRDTNISARRVDFEDGSVLTESDLDTNTDHVLFGLQEVLNHVDTKVFGTNQIDTDAVTNIEIANNSVTSTHLHADTVVINSEQAGATANDTSFFTTLASDGRYFRQDSSETILSGASWSSSDGYIASTAAIDARIIDLVDDVGGFVPIANETSFPDANPDVNNGAGTLISIKALASNLVSNGSGVATISNGNASNNATITINGLANSTTYAAGFGMIVETTSTLHTYTFHRQTPKATEVTTVAGISSNVTTVAGAVTNINTVATNIAAVNSFANTYSIAGSDPTSGLNTGDLYFNTSSNELRVYNGSSWQAGVTATGNLASTTGATFTGEILIDNQKELRFGEPDGAGVQYVGFEAPDTIASNVIWKLPNADGSSNQTLKTDGSGNLSWTTPLLLTGGTLTGDLILNAQKDLRFADSDSSHYVALQAPATIGTSYTLTLPTADGNANQLLKTDGSGNLSWSTDTTLTLLDEDNFASNSATSPASQQSVKAYVDTADALKANLAGPTFTGTINGASLILSGDLTVNGTTTTINSTTLAVDDKNIELGSVSSPSDTTADGGGITLKGSTDKTITWSNSTDTWDFNHGVKITGNLTVDTNTLHVDATNNRVGIGTTTTNTSYPLCVASDNNAQSILVIGRSADDISEIGFFENDTTTRLGEIQYRQDHVNFRHRIGDIRFATGGSTERMRIDSSGRLLLGTTTEGFSSANDLTIANSGHAGITIRSGDDDTGNIYFSDATSGGGEYAGYLEYSHVTNALRIGTGGTGTVALTLDSSQNATFAGTVSDSKGDVRSIPQNTQGSAYTLVAADAGKHVLASGNITVPDSVFTAGQAITIINNTSGDLTINKGTNMYNTADGTSENRTLATRGMATILFTAANTSYISGAGLS